MHDVVNKTSAKTFPMDLRPQGHDIIRTWLFSTLLRSHLEHDSLPWSDTALSGWILDPDRKKMSKSKGNVVTPDDLVVQYGADAIRYWAANGRPGTDTALDEGQMKVGRRLAIKILNASKFALSLGAARDEAGAAAPTTTTADGSVDLSVVTQPLDLALLARLAGLVGEATSAFEGYDYARALERTESFFWKFCDEYLELVKGRAYGAAGEAEAASAQATLQFTLSTLLRLFAPFLPYVTEEVWSWWQPGSVHRAAWPDIAEFGERASVGDPLVYEVAAAVLGEVRKAKTEAKRSLRAEVERVIVGDNEARLDALRGALGDVTEAGRIAAIDLEPAGELTVTVTLAPEEA